MLAQDRIRHSVRAIRANAVRRPYVSFLLRPSLGGVTIDRSRGEKPPPPTSEGQNSLGPKETFLPLSFSDGVAD